MEKAMIKLNIKFSIIFLLLIFFTTASFAKEKTFTKEAVEVVPASQSQDQVTAYLTQKLTREATEEAGTFITSELNIKNYEITKDEFTSFAGAISKVKVENKETFMKNGQQYVKLKLNVTVDTDNVKTYLEKIMQDNEYKKEAEELRQKNLELEKQLKTATKQQYEKELSTQVKQQVELQKKQELEIEKLTLKAKEEFAKAKEEQDKKTAEREKEILKLKEQIAQEQNNIKKAELENQARIKELENKAKNELKNYSAKTKTMTVQQVIEEVKGLKKKILEITTNFETLIKNNRDNLIKSYDEQIKLSVNDSGKGMWETSDQYFARLKNNTTAKQQLEWEKADSIFEYNVKTLDSMFITLEPFQKRLKELQDGQYFDKSRKSFAPESLGYVYMDQEYFPVNIKYKGEEYSLKFNFDDIGVEKAQLVYKTQKQFVIEPLFSVNNNMKAELIGFYGKHLGVGSEKYWDFRKTNYKNTKLEELSEIKEIEKYKELDEALKILKNLSELDKVRRELYSYELKFQYDFINSTYEKNKNFMTPILTELKSENILDKENFIKKVSPLSKKIVAIAADIDSVALKANGTVATTQYGVDVYKWKDIVAICENTFTILGIKKDKTVAVTGGDNEYGQNNVSDWTNIVAVAGSREHTVGLRGDGTVVATGNNKVGQCDVKDWKDIVSVAAGYGFTLGLKKDGTIVFAGFESYEKKEKTEFFSKVKDIVRIKARGSKIILTNKSGNVSVPFYHSLFQYGEEKTELWYSIVDVAAGHYHTVGLDCNGKVYACGNNEKGQCKVSNWKDVIAIAAGFDHTFALKADGSLVSCGAEINVNGKIVQDDPAKVKRLLYLTDEKGNYIYDDTINATEPNIESGSGSGNGSSSSARKAMRRTR